MRSIVSRITNISFEQDDLSWCQASLPINHCGLGFQSCSSLAPSAFLASADGESQLMQKLLPPHLQTATYISKDRALTAWKDALPADTPLPTNTTHQKSWDLPIVQLHLGSLLARYVDQSSCSRILRASCRESEAWLNALPISSLGLRMSDDTDRTAIGLHVGTPICLPHPCSSCSHPVDEFGHHGLSCKFSIGRTPRHHMLKTIIHHSLASANIPRRLEPSNLLEPFNLDSSCGTARMRRHLAFATPTSQLQPEKLVEPRHLLRLGRPRSMPIEQLGTFHREKQIGLRWKYISLKRNNPDSLNLLVWKKCSLYMWHTTMQANKGKRVCTEFSPSGGWLSRFKYSNGNTLRTLHGEAASVDVSVVSDAWSTLKDVLSKYEPADIYNVDETGLFYRMPPSKSFAQGPFHETKQFKDRITIAFCANADVSDYTSLW